MKRILMGLALAVFAGVSNAHAGGKTPTYEIGYSTFATVSVICTTGTAVNISTTPYTPQAQGPWAGFVVENQDSADTVWFGDDKVNAAVGSGLRLAPAGTWSVHLGKAKKSPNWLTPFYCEADSAAGAAGVQLLMFWFGY